MLDWHGRWNGRPLSTSWSLLSRCGHFCPGRCQTFDISPLITWLLQWWKCLKREFSDLTRASYGKEGSDDDYCRGLHLRSLVFDPDTKTKERGFQPWWLKASASFWFMDYWALPSASDIAAGLTFWLHSPNAATGKNPTPIVYTTVWNRCLPNTELWFDPGVCRRTGTVYW